MILATMMAVLFGARTVTASPDNPELLRRACPDYTSYASAPQLVVPYSLLLNRNWLSSLTLPDFLQWPLQRRAVTPPLSTPGRSV